MTVTMGLQERVAVEEAWNHLRRGDLAAVENSLKRLTPPRPSYYLLSGFLQLMRGENKAATDSFQLVLKEIPRLALAQAGLAQAYLNLGDEEAAFSSLREVLKEEPDNDWAKKEFNALKSKRTDSLREAAAAALKANNLAGAKEALLQALHYSPEATDLHLSLARLYRQEKNLSAALTHLKAAVDLSPQDKQLRRNYAETLLEAEQYSRALEALERLLELEPENKEVQAKLTALKDKLGIIELPSQYENIPRLEAISREDLASLIAVKFKGFLPPLPESPPIIVDIATSWASRFILQAASLGFLDVYPDHTFRPKNIVTRAEMADTLVRLLNFFRQRGKKFIAQIPPEKIILPDITPEHAFYASVIEALAYQLMELSADKRFNPERPVSGLEASRTLEVLLALVK